MTHNKKILSLISVFCAFAIIIGGAFAFFFDSSVLTGTSKIGAVDINVKGGLYHSDSLNNLNPGDNDPNIPENYRPGTDHELSLEIDNLGNKSVIYRTVVEISATKLNGTPFTEEELMSIILSEKGGVTEATTQENIAPTDTGKQTEITRLKATGYEEGKLLYIVGGTTEKDLTYVLNGVGDNAEIETGVSKSNDIQVFDIGLDKDISSEVLQGATITFNVAVQAIQYRNTGDPVWNEIFNQTYTSQGTPSTDNDAYKNDNGTVFAIYSEDDNSLTFFNRSILPEEGSIYKVKTDDRAFYEKTATKVYYGFETSSDIPWSEDHIEKIVVVDSFTPITTAHWFEDLNYATYFDLDKLDTSLVTDMSYMFADTGYTSTIEEYVITGMEKWNVSNVTNMSHMFEGAGRSQDFCDFGDFSNWNTSSLTDISYMFASTGSNADTFEIKGIHTWNTSKVENMSQTFNNAGPAFTTWALNIENWSTESVNKMDYMFHYCKTLNQVTIGNNFSFSGNGTVSGGKQYLPAVYGPDVPLADGHWINIDTFEKYTPEEIHTKADKVAATYIAVAKYTVIFDANNGSGEKYHSTYNYAGTACSLRINFKYPGYKFISWNTKPDGSGQSFNYDDKPTNLVTSIKDTITLYAQWEEKTEEIYAVSLNDGTIRFYNGIAPDKGDVIKTSDGKEAKVMEVFYDFADKEFASPQNVPWTRYYEWCTGIYIEDEMSPDYITYWFTNSGCSYFDLGKLDTSKITNMSMLFLGVGYDSLTIKGLENWDTSNVINMSQLFATSGKDATKIDISGIEYWDTSKVTAMDYAFFLFGINAQPYSLNLSNWSTESITNMEMMFGYTDSLKEITLGSNFKFIGSGNQYLQSPKQSTLPEADGSGLWYIKGTSQGFVPADVHKNTNETTTYVVYPTN